MTSVQLDLLTDLEQEQRHKTGDFTWLRRWATTGTGARASCIWCRNEARWDHIHNNCAGTWQPRPIGPCTTQYLLTNHVRYYARALVERDATVTDPSGTGRRPFDEDLCREQLTARIAKARAAQVDVDAILTEISAHCGDLCPFRGCPTCPNQGDTNTDHPERED